MHKTPIWGKGRS